MPQSAGVGSGSSAADLGVRLLSWGKDVMVSPVSHKLPRASGCAWPLFPIQTQY